MRRKDRELKNEQEILDVLAAGEIAQIAFVEDGEPYIVTMNYGYEQEGEWLQLYFHSAREGRKIECIKKNPRVCFTVALPGDLVTGERACDYGMKFSSVVGYGTLSILESEQERLHGLKILMKQFTESANKEWEFDPHVMHATTVLRLDVETITGKRK